MTTAVASRPSLVLPAPRRWLALVPGLLVLAVIGYAGKVAEQSIAAYGRAHHLALPNIEYVLWAIVFGLIISNTIGVPAICQAGIDTYEFWLKSGIVLLGVRFVLGDVVRLGGVSLACVVVELAVSIAVMTALGRAFRLSPKLTSLLSIGASICGVSAIIAAKGAIDADDEDASYAVAAILALGAISLFLFPVIGHALGMSDHAYGLWVGLAVDNTAEATAAGAMYSDAAGRFAVLAKTTRNATIGFVVLGYALYWVRRGGAARVSHRGRFLWEKFPKFVLGFLAVSALATFGAFTKAQAADIANLSRWAFLFTFAGIGLRTNLRAIVRQGWRPLVVGVAGEVAIAVLTLVMIAGVAERYLSAESLADAHRLAGRWDATLTLNGATIPFRLDIADESGGLKGTLFNGDDTEKTTAASFSDGVLVLDLGHYLTRIVASVQDGELDGRVHLKSDKMPDGSPFHAKRHADASVAMPASVPAIAGVWEIPHETAKGEKAWRLIVKQSGGQASAAILRVDGDTGELTGDFRDGAFVLSHFDGSRPARMEITPTSEGTLRITQTGGSRPLELVAFRPEAARAMELPEPANYSTHTKVRDANEIFAFSGRDLDGNVVSNTDPRFRGKVVLVDITGTWCPNCHDEAQYLTQIYRKYHDRGLEIVALDFEEADQQASLDRVHAFIKQYGVEYMYLIEGAPADLAAKVPQAVNLNTWPATFFVGRDGKVKNVHAGFAAPASGEFHRQLDAEFTSTIEQLLHNRTPVETGHEDSGR